MTQSENPQNEYQLHRLAATQYALEGMKTLFVLNGAAAVSILTFAGNSKPQSFYLVFAMIAFALGSTFGGFGGMLGAYLAELHYGNARRLDIQATAHEHAWHKGVCFHFVTYLAIGLGVFFFFLGIILAACSFLRAS